MYFTFISCNRLHLVNLSIWETILDKGMSHLDTSLIYYNEFLYKSDFWCNTGFYFNILDTHVVSVMRYSIEEDPKRIETFM